MTSTTCPALNPSQALCTQLEGHSGRHTYPRNRAAYFARYYQENKDTYNKYWRERYAATDAETRSKCARRKKYKLTPDQITNLLAAQGSVCLVCGNPVEIDWSARTFAVDHDHACCPGKKSCGECVRGVLHIDCNKSLGFLEKFEAAGQAQILGPLRDYVWSKRAVR